LLLETKVANMEIKMVIMEERGGNNGKREATMAKEEREKNIIIQFIHYFLTVFWG